MEPPHTIKHSSIWGYWVSRYTLTHHPGHIGALKTIEVQELLVQSSSYQEIIPILLEMIMVVEYRNWRRTIWTELSNVKNVRKSRRVQCATSFRLSVSSSFNAQRVLQNGKNLPAPHSSKRIRTRYAYDTTEHRGEYHLKHKQGWCDDERSRLSQVYDAENGKKKLTNAHQVQRKK